mmetsp:Transcript_100486/g.324023  ORF Transcript_100486/g.324023 Transcript_100486/m.324023 type:complete len:635 (+) Transcript_100486:347-2251(+)
MTLPVQTCTTVADVKVSLAYQTLTDPEALIFIVKQGCSWVVLKDTAEMARRATVKGILSFEPRRCEYPHPTAIIGAGYNGIKHAIYWLHHGDANFVMFDRHDRVGGTAWLTQANKTSRLQTEMAAFHVWFGLEWGPGNDRLGFPTSWETWPAKDKVLEHLQHAVERYGVLPHIRFRSNISDLSFEGNHKDLTDMSRSYWLAVQSVNQDEKVTEDIRVSNIYHFPGAFSNPRIIEYPGEADFGGRIGYGMNDDIPFENLKGSRTAILGNGAFAIENIRTCMEYGAAKVFLVTRRKNLALPRLCCWFCHQAIVPYPAGMLLNIMAPMYDACGFGDPWDYHAVYGNKEKGACTIRSSSRFGIGDVTFLAVATGRCEYVVDLLKRCSRGTLHLQSGQRLERVDNIIKALGLIADFGADRLHKIKEMVGIWPSGDFRRVIHSDPLGMDAQNFSTHSTGGASYAASVSSKFFIDYPAEMQLLHAEGLLDRLPRMRAGEEKPAHQFDAKYTMVSAVTVESMCRRLQFKFFGLDDYMHQLFSAVNPLDKYYQECIDSWDRYQEEWRLQGFEHEYVPYPYTRELVDRWFEEYDARVGPTSVESKKTWRPVAERDSSAQEEPIDLRYDRGGSREWWEQHGALPT